MSAIFLFVSHLPVCNTRLSYILTNQKIRKGSRQIDADLQREALNVTKRKLGNYLPIHLNGVFAFDCLFNNRAILWNKILIRKVMK